MQTPPAPVGTVPEPERRDYIQFVMPDGTIVLGRNFSIPAHQENYAENNPMGGIVIPPPMNIPLPENLDMRSRSERIRDSIRRRRRGNNNI
tara:strand:- start:721 stop:993 length:273 start_codon:yes stop_codon:yes gene_type:complete